MSRAWAAGVVAVIAALVPAGCADGSGQADDGPTSAPTVPSEPAEPTDPTHPTTTPQPTEPDAPGAAELVGLPEPGVEGGCWLLDGHLLLGIDDELVSSGQRLRVTGTVERDVATTCQQGIPFRVETAEPVE